MVLGQHNTPYQSIFFSLVPDTISLLSLLSYFLLGSSCFHQPLRKEPVLLSRRCGSTRTQRNWTGPGHSTLPLFRQESTSLQRCFAAEHYHKTGKPTTFSRQTRISSTIRTQSRYRGLLRMPVLPSSEVNVFFRVCRHQEMFFWLSWFCLQSNRRLML